MDKLEFVKSIPALKNFSRKFLDKFVQIMETGHAKQGEVIFQENEPSDHLYIISDGEAIITKKITPDTEKLLSVLGERDIFGEMSLFSNQPRTASVKAKTDLSYYKIHRSSFKKLIALDPEGTQKMLETLLLSALARLEHTSRELATVYEISKIIVKNLTLEEFCHQIIRHLCLAVPDVDAGMLFVWNEFTDEYDSMGLYGEKVRKVSVPKNDTLVSFLSEKTETIPIEKTEILPAKSYLVTPMLKEKLQGFIILANTKKNITYPQGTKDLLNSVGLQLIGAIENIRNLQEKIAKERLERGRSETVQW